MLALFHRKSSRAPHRRLAAMDIGTHSFHLVVVEIFPDGKFRILDRAKEVVRMGESASDMKYLSPQAMDRGIAVLRTFSKIAANHQAEIRAVATSAVREALNQNDFIRRAKEETGIGIEIISGVEEARLIYLGALQALPVYRKKVLLMDIGGGSVEFIIGKKGRAKYATSLKLGCIRLTHRFFKKPALSPKDIQACRKYVIGFLSSIRSELEQEKIDMVVGTSGTIQNVASMIQLKRRNGRGRDPDDGTFSIKELEKLAKEICDKKTTAERMKIKGLDPKRADIIVAGVIVLLEAFRMFKISEMTCSDFALREGIVYDFIHNRLFKFKNNSAVKNLRLESVLRLAQVFHYEETHTRQIGRLALSLFDQTRTLHKMGQREREFLQMAAILHEIGLFISHNQHHRHSYYLIRNSELPGFTETEKEIIANIARYHRKSHPKQRHPEFSRLTEADQNTVKILSGILRIGNALDRSHKAKISGIKIQIQKKKITIRCKSRADVSLEFWAANMKKTLLEECLKRKIEFTESR